MSDKRLPGRVAVVIGGASGIGWASAQLMAEHGASVVIADIDGDHAAERAASLGAAARAQRVDVTDESSVEALFTSVSDDFGRCDVVLNCAGGSGIGLVADLDADVWRQTIDLCLTGAFLVVKHAARAMGDGGSIITIASLNARQPGAGFAAYCSAKAGVAMLTEVAALELGPKSIRVNAISPGLVETPLVAGITAVPTIQDDFTENIPLVRNGQPDDIAAAVLYLASEDSSWVTGEVLNVNGGGHLRRYPDILRHLTELQG
ncbi:SDR family NAD(P)-dependent oxidoreductase [Gordonia neofelifaecis]|uniref:Short-chain dehydrogenase/reductase SDR n=1 Tax=Gordonia neofelifaecis NRRL B-59395 TaxID=644548 RepID=F1YNQ0_9ACTN|nr:SDR family oxidoreductase [Gordonia neofelifaecis]EGD53657.1 short-chain dehydrogenase/reductase SDR [Gordonia neofelifaecis NRRL B-59395]